MSWANLFREKAGLSRGWKVFSRGCYANGIVPQFALCNARRWEASLSWYKRSLKGDRQVGSYIIDYFHPSTFSNRAQNRNRSFSRFTFSLNKIAWICDMRISRSEPIKRARLLFSFKMAASLTRSRGAQLHLLGHPRESYLHLPYFHPSTYSTLLLFVSYSVQAFKSPPIHIYIC